MPRRAYVAGEPLHLDIRLEDVELLTPYALSATHFDERAILVAERARAMGSIVRVDSVE